MGPARKRPMIARVTRAAWLAAIVSAMLLLPLAVSNAGDVPIAQVTVGRNPVAVAVNPVSHRVYVANYWGDSVSVIDGMTDNVTATVPMPLASSAAAIPIAVVADPLRGRAFVANWQSHRVSAIEEPTSVLVATITVPAINSGNPRALALDPTSVPPKLYVANYARGSVSVIDASALTRTKDVVVGTQPRALGVFSSLTRKRVFVANGGSGNVHVIDTDTDAVVATLTAGTSPKSVAVDPSTGWAYVTNAGSDNVTVIDDSDRVTATVAVGDNPVGVAIDSANGRVFVANYLSNSVSVISTSTNSVVATLGVGAAPFAIVFDAGDGKAFVSCYSSREVVVITSALATVSVPAGDRPYALAIDDGASPHKVYASNWGSGTVTVIDEPAAPKIVRALGVETAHAAAPSPVSASVDPLPGGVTTTATPVFSGSASSARSPYACAVVAVFYRFDSETAWRRATITEGAGTASVRWSVACGTPLAPGAHQLYVAAMDQAMAVSSSSPAEGGGAGSGLGSPAAYAFSYTDAPPADTEPPDLTLIGVADGASYNTTVAPDAATSDATARIAATLNGSAFTLGSDVGAEGNYAFVAVATDPAGNSTTASADFTIDRTAPDVSVTGVSDGGVYGGARTVGAVSADGSAALAATLDGAPFVLGSEVSEEGTHALLVTATDPAGNVGAAAAVFVIDTIPPSGTMSLDGGAPSTGSTTCSVDSAVIGAARMRLDVGEGFGDWFDFAGSVQVTLPAGDGVKTVRADYRDLALNSLSLEDTIVLDTVAPAVLAAEQRVAAGAPVALQALADDSATGGSAIVSAAYSLDGGPWTAMSAADGVFDEPAEGVTALLGPFAGGGLHTVRYRGTDSAGNVSGTAEALLIVESLDSWNVDVLGTLYPGGKRVAITFKGTVSGGLVGSASLRVTNSVSVRASSAEWIAIGSGIAYAHGPCTVDGRTGYEYGLTAIDAADSARLAVWDASTGDVVLDTTPLAEPYDPAAVQPLVRGSVRIVQPRKQ